MGLVRLMNKLDMKVKMEGHTKRDLHGGLDMEANSGIHQRRFHEFRCQIA